VNQTTEQTSDETSTIGTVEVPEYIGTCTYCAVDNKLRLTPFRRLDAETYARVKTAGFAWAPRQEIFVAPMWTPAREDLALELCGDIEDEDTTLEERAAARAERFEEYSEKRAQDAESAKRGVDRIAEGIPFGQPILVGHHSERHARKDAERIRSGMARAVKNWETSKYWTERAAASLKHAARKEAPAVRFRRIKTIESDARKAQKSIDVALTFIGMWRNGNPNDEPITRERAMTIANRDHVSLKPKAGESWGTTLWGALDKNEITPEHAATVACETHERTIQHARRWLTHYECRIAYERALLGESTHTVADVVAGTFNVSVGGKVLANYWRTNYRDEWLVVKRVSRGANGCIASVSTSRGVIPIENVKKYEEPTAENVAKVKAASKLPPLVNYPGEGFVETTRAQWDRRSAEDKKARTAQATSTHGAMRYRESWLPGGSWKTAQVYLTDAPRVDRPLLAEKPAEPVTFEREIPLESALAGMVAMAESKQRRDQREAEEAASPFAQMKESLKAGVTVVSADQLFPTPDALADRLVAIADIKPGMRVLEPSAGTGSIVRAIRRAVPDADVTAWEINAQVAKASGATHMDFLLANPELRFPRIVANPPFADGADVLHVTRMIRMLATGGILVAIMSAGVKFRHESKYKIFRQFISDIGGTFEDLPDDSFASQGTKVRTVMLTVES
jgi:hypothetical protein